MDFQRKVQPGDSFDVLYSDDENDEGRNEVRYVSLTVGGETKKYYHFQTADDGTYDYYDETGKSAKKFLVRKPVPIGIMRSRLRRAKPSAASLYEDAYRRRLGGTVRYADLRRRQRHDRRDRRQRRLRQIRPHPPSNGYETAYGHMTAFARGLNVGSRVRQGQVIGFVGSTGLSTGAHVHFEILINDRFVESDDGQAAARPCA